LNRALALKSPCRPSGCVHPPRPVVGIARSDREPARHGRKEGTTMVNAIDGAAGTAKRLKKLGRGLLVASAILFGDLAVPSRAPAMRMSCSTAKAVAQSYIATGNVFYGLGDYQSASYWYGRAEGVLQSGC